MLTLTISPIAERHSSPLPSRPAVQVWRDRDGTPRAYGFAEGNDRWMHWPGVASFHFRSGSSDVLAIPEPLSRPEIITEAYQRCVLPMALQAQGFEALHASAVVMSQGVVGFCAGAEVGKSTVAFGLLRRGCRQWADDALVVDVTGQVPQAVQLPFHARLRPASSRFFGESGSPRPWSPNRAGRGESMRLAALCVLNRLPEGTAVEGATVIGLNPSNAFRAVLANAFCFDPQNAQRTRLVIEHYLTMVSSIPVFEVRFAPALPELPLLLDRITTAVDIATATSHASGL